MCKLIGLDFKRVFKDRLFLVLCILAGVFALITPLLYFFLLGETDPMLEEMMGDMLSSKTHFFSAFSLSNNLGLIVPVLLAIILCKDFSSGTVRNKLIGGYSRTAVFFALFAVCFVVLWGIMLLHAVLTLGVSSLFFDYQSTAFTVTDLWYLLQSLLFELLVYLFIAALIACLCAVAKNMGLVIVLYVSALLVFTMISAILEVSITVLTYESGTDEMLREVLQFLQRINVFNYPNVIGMGTQYEAADFAYYTLSPLFGTATLLFVGALRFSKKDLK